MAKIRQGKWTDYVIHSDYQDCGLKGTICVLLIITLIIVVPILWYEAWINRNKDDAGQSTTTVPLA